MSEVRMRYRPQVGMLRPYEVVTLPIAPAIGSHEQAILLSAETRAVIMNENPDWVRIRNSGSVLTPFLLIVVPRAMLKVALHPWPEIMQTLASELETEHGVRALIRGIAAIVARSS